MVLEHLFPDDWLEQKLFYAFILAFVYSTVAIIIARLLFAANSGIVSVIIVSLLLMPYLEVLLAEEEEKEEKELTLSIREMYLDNKGTISVYFSLFLGIYVAYMLYTFLLPQFGVEVGRVFGEQLALETNQRGGAFFSGGLFMEIFLNNWWVLLACFLLALVGGDGALFFVAWNASSWGAIFGLRALAAGDAAYGAWLNLLLIVVITLPHLILEGGAYILAAISGGVLSDDVTSKREAMEKFIYWFIGGILLFAVSFFLFRALFGYEVMVNGIPRTVTGILVTMPLVASFLNIVVVVVFLHLLSYVFDDPRHKEVFQYNYYLFLLALALFVLAAFVETIILDHATMLNVIYGAAFGF